LRHCAADDLVASRHIPPYARQPWTRRRRVWPPLEGCLNQPVEAVITVCDAANESCPVFFGATSRLHYGASVPGALCAGLSPIAVGSLSHSQPQGLGSHSGPVLVLSCSQASELPWRHSRWAWLKLGALCLDRCVVCLWQRYAALFRDGHAISHPQTIWCYLKEKPNRAPRRPSFPTSWIPQHFLCKLAPL